MIATAQAVRLLRDALAEVTNSDGSAATERFNSLRDVDSKVREVKIVLEGVQGLPPALVGAIATDPDFSANSRRVRLEALANYIRSGIKFLETGAFEKPEKVIYAPPSLAPLAGTMLGLQEELEGRWREAQKCMHVGAYTSAVILMGSILEGLLLARAQLSVAAAYQATRAPRDKIGRQLAVHDWALNALIDVAVELGWLKADRGKFSHALRESRNIVHPWQAVTIRAKFDNATCVTSWSVLEAAVDDLLSSIK